MRSSDTIAAIATPLGQGGVGIVRLSGPQSPAIGRRIFRSARRSFSGFNPYVLHHGWIVSPRKEILDEVLVSYMPAPGSYTAEDVLEVNCHGGPAVVQAVLELALEHGARLAAPGEFTWRAFMNGRIDLSQAESVAEMVAASTQSGMRLAGAKLGGGLQRKIQGLKAKLQELQAALCATVDFPEEEGAEELNREETARSILEVDSGVQELLENFSRYRCWREGASVVLAGRVNAGKSSLLNALLGRNRAIVTSTPGTTRDYLEETINLSGVPVRLVDTAGLRPTLDEVELAGLEQGRELTDQADLVCLVLDQHSGPDEEARQLAARLGPEKLLLVLNKMDLPPYGESLKTWFSERGFECEHISVKTGQGLDALTSRIRERIIGHLAEPEEQVLVPNLRQREHLRRARQEIEDLQQALAADRPPELLSVHLDAACRELAEITGEITTEDILDQVFSTFCIGK